MNWLLVIMVVLTPIAHAPEEEWASKALFNGQTGYTSYASCMQVRKQVLNSIGVNMYAKSLVFCAPAWRKAPYTRKEAK